MRQGSKLLIYKLLGKDFGYLGRRLSNWLRNFDKKTENAKRHRNVLPTAEGAMFLQRPKAACAAGATFCQRPKAVCAEGAMLNIYSATHPLPRHAPSITPRPAQLARAPRQFKINYPNYLIFVFINYKIIRKLSFDSRFVLSNRLLI